MRDLNQVVDFNASTNESPSKSRAVDGRVGTYLHIVLQFHDTHLRYFDPLVILPRVAKTIAPDNNAGMQHHTVADPTTITNDNVRMEHTILANPNPLPQKDTRIKNGPRTDVNSAAHKDVRQNCDARFQIGRRVDIGLRANLLRVTRCRAKQLQNFGESYIGVGSFQIAEPLPRRHIRNDSGADDNRAGPGRCQETLITRVGKKSNITGPSFFDGCNFPNRDPIIANDRSPNITGQFP